MNTQKQQTFHTDEHLRFLRQSWDGRSVSPALALMLEVGTLDDGCPDYREIRCGEIVKHGGLLFRIEAFTRSNTLLLRPHGLGHNPIVSGIEVIPHSGLFIADAAPEFIAQGGLVVMEG